MNIKQAMMLTAMLGTVPDAADRDESIAFVAFEAFMEKKTYGRGLTIERITYPLFHNGMTFAAFSHVQIIRTAPSAPIRWSWFFAAAGVCWSASKRPTASSSTFANFRGTNMNRERR